MAAAAYDVRSMLDRHETIPSEIGRFQPYSELSLALSGIPWAILVGIVHPYYQAQRPSERPYHLEWVLRIWFLQDCAELSAEEILCALNTDSVVRNFVGMNTESIPPTRDTIVTFQAMLLRHGLMGRLAAITDRHLSRSDRNRLRSYLSVYLQSGRDGAYGPLGRLSRYFESISAPYGLADIRGFNGIYHQIYRFLSPSEKLRAEQYVDALIAGVEHPDYAAKIYGVV